MGNPNYQAGRRLEWDFIEMMEVDGYKCMRSAGSKTLIDVLCLPTSKAKGQRIIAAQLKRYTSSEPKPDQDFIDLDIDVEKWWVTKKKFGCIRITKLEKPEVVVICSSPDSAPTMGPGVEGTMNTSEKIGTEEQKTTVV